MVWGRGSGSGAAGMRATRTGECSQANRGVCRWVASGRRVGNRDSIGARQGEPGVAEFPASRVPGGPAPAERRRRSSLTPLWTPTSTNLLDAQNGPMANLGVELVNIYAAYTQGGTSAANLPAEFPEDPVPERHGRGPAQEPRRRLQPVPQPAHRRRHAGHDLELLLRAGRGVRCRSTSCRRSPNSPRPRADRRPRIRSSTADPSIRAKPTTRRRPRCSPTSRGTSSTSTGRASRSACSPTASASTRAGSPTRTRPAT